MQGEVATEITVVQSAKGEPQVHLRADLTKTGKIEDGVLTCSLHDWKWDLASGKCLTSQGHPIRASQAEADRAADAPAA